MTINQIQDQIIEEFSAFDDWMDRYALLIDMGGALPALEEQYKTPDHLIEGCQSRVWIVAQPGGDGRINFLGESDAIIVKGIVALLLRVLSGQRPEDIVHSDLYFIEAIGLTQHLSPTRSNGLLSMLQRMRLLSVQMLASEK